MNWLFAAIGLLVGCFAFTMTRLIYDECMVMRTMKREQRKILQVEVLTPQPADQGLVP